MAWLLHDPLTRFVAQIAVVIIVARLLGLGARRIGQPLVIAEITAGIVLGPSLLGWLAPGVSAALFAPESLDELRMVAQLGLVLFMFLVGLELDLGLLRGRGRAALVISHTSIVVPFALGIGLAAWMHGRYAAPDVSLAAFALFLGAAMSITAFPVLARILAERRLLGTRMGAITIACAAVDDATAWCVLAFVVAVARADGVAGAVVTTGVALVYVGAMVALVRPLLARVGARVASTEALSQDKVALVLVLVLLSAWATERIGIHALFGAFLFGAILPRDGGLARALAEKLEDAVVILLLPLFFAYSGLRTQIGLLATAEDWLACGAIVAIACLGKFGGSVIPARLTGLSWRESGALGVLLNTRGLMELIVLNIGLDLGVISPTVFSMMVVMALVTTVMTTPILGRIYPADVMARGLVEAAVGPAAPPIPAPPQLLACVAQAGAGPGLVTAARLVGGPGAAVVALHLARPVERTSRLGRAGGEPDVIAPALARARALELPARALSFVSAEPAREICAIAARRDVELVLLGLHKPVLGRSLLGGVVRDVLRDCRSTVAVLRDRGLGEPRRVLVPFQGSPHDRAALRLAGRIQATTGARITLLHVVRRGRERASEVARRVEELVEAHGRVVVEIVEHASPADAALDRAGDHDLVVVGVGREWGLGGRRFGLAPERLLRDAPSSVLVVREARAPR